MADPVRAHVVVSGRVQGVFFRVELRDMARRLGLSGWVRNTADGSVEAVFEGPSPGVREAISWCRHGPPLAKVESTDVSSAPPEGLSDFRIVH
jgi:acylphosphatase